MRHVFTSTFCRKVDFVSRGIQDKRSCIDANFLDEYQALFLFNQMTFYDARRISCFAPTITFRMHPRLVNMRTSSAEGYRSSATTGTDCRSESLSRVEQKPRSR